MEDAPLGAKKYFGPFFKKIFFTFFDRVKMLSMSGFEPGTSPIQALLSVTKLSGLDE
jgi:hypothetical protein